MHFLTEHAVDQQLVFPSQVMSLFQFQTYERQVITIEPRITRIKHLVALGVEYRAIGSKARYRAFGRGNRLYIRQVTKLCT